ncbi:hypothetical protein ACXM1Q_000940 [Streptococcus sp. 10F2]
MKKLALIIGISSLLFLMIRTYYTIKKNLIFYSVYYAQNLEHDPSYNPTMAMIIDNLDYISRPENDLIKYDFDGHNTVYNLKYNIRLTGSIEEYMLFHVRDIYYFTGKGEFLEFRVLASDTSLSDNSKERREEGEKFVNELLQSIIDIQPSPPQGQNLQWLFNITYGKRFQ